MLNFFLPITKALLRVFSELHLCSVISYGGSFCELGAFPPRTIKRMCSLALPICIWQFTAWDRPIVLFMNIG